METDRVKPRVIGARPADTVVHAIAPNDERINRIKATTEGSFTPPNVEDCNGILDDGQNSRSI
jgi:hypothetical protein